MRVTTDELIDRFKVALANAIRAALDGDANNQHKPAKHGRHGRGTRGVRVAARAPAERGDAAGPARGVDAAETLSSEDAGGPGGAGDGGADGGAERELLVAGDEDAGTEARPLRKTKTPATTCRRTGTSKRGSGE